MSRRNATDTTREPNAALLETNGEFVPEAGQVLIRMYGQGVGDCFLLALPRSRETATIEADNTRPVYVLIDCGVVMGTPDDSERMMTIVGDIKTVTDGHLDLLVITHEHWDHLSGFLKAEDLWKQFTIDALWMAWTEKKNDPSGLPDVLKKILAKQRRTLAAVADHAIRLGLEDRHETVLGLMSFLSDEPTDAQGFSAAPSVGDAFNFAKGLVDPQSHVCCDPGEVRRLPGTDAVCYVLGPPRSDARLRRLNPTKDNETYEATSTSSGEDKAVSPEEARRLAAMHLSEQNMTFSLQRMAENRSALNALAMPLLGPSWLGVDGAGTSEEVALESDLYERSFPFDRSVRIPLVAVEAAITDTPGAYPVLESYADDVNNWRRIDVDWLDAAETLALQADSLTNNTSLVLAIELPAGSGKTEQNVLLFVGDAQVGNWLSWEDIDTWHAQGDAKASATQAKPDIADLLKRTVFYKVGHHGSHNATLKAKGIERMGNGKELTAFVPVSAAVACTVKRWCGMPLNTMLTALSQRAGSQVVLPNGTLWSAESEGTTPIQPTDRGLRVSKTNLPAKVRTRDHSEEQLEPEVPLWVEVTIDY